MSQSKDFLGRGFSFPPKVDKATGKFIMVEQEEDIKQAISIILLTRLNERAMLPAFGCDLIRYIYQIPDPTFEHLLCMEILDALTMHEPRIREVEVSVEKIDAINGAVYLNINYYVRATNNPNNLVFPYYMNEGVGVI